MWCEKECPDTVCMVWSIVYSGVRDTCPTQNFLVPVVGFDGWNNAEVVLCHYHCESDWWDRIPLIDKDLLDCIDVVLIGFTIRSTLQVHDKAFGQVTITTMELSHKRLWSNEISGCEQRMTTRKEVIRQRVEEQDPIQSCLTLTIAYSDWDDTIPRSAWILTACAIRIMALSTHAVPTTTVLVSLPGAVEEHGGKK